MNYRGVHFKVRLLLEGGVHLMGEGFFILLTRGYGFIWGVPAPFDTLKKCTFAYDMSLTFYR